MRKSHSLFQTRRKRSLTERRDRFINACKSIKEYERPCNVDIVLNSDNNNSIIINSEVEMVENKLGDIEYTKALQLALKDAINLNEKLSEELHKYMQENKELREELEDKDNAIYELSQYYHFCQNNHINNNDDEGTDNNDTDYKINTKQRISQKNSKAKKRKSKRKK